MKTICGLDCCGACDRKEACGGCLKTNGRPFGGTCVAAEWMKKGGKDEFLRLKNNLIDEINSLGIENLQIADLNLLNGFYVNLEFTLPSGQSVKFLEDKNIYWGNQVEIPDSDRCYGLVADDSCLLVCEYGCGGADPQIVMFQRRQAGTEIKKQNLV